MLAHIPPEETGFFLCLLPLFPPLSRQACCFCFTSQNNSEVISFLRGRKHRRVLCYVNNKCSCPQALAQVVNKLVNYIDINAIGLELKLPFSLRCLCPSQAAPCQTSCRRRLLRGSPASRCHGGGWCELTLASSGKCTAPDGGFQITPFDPPFLPKAGAQGFGATSGVRMFPGGFGSPGTSG